MATDENLFTFLSLGQSLTRTFSFFVDRLDIFLSISTVVHLPAIVVAIVIVLLLAPSASSTEGADGHADFLSNHIASILVVVYSQLILTSLVTITGEGGMVRAAADIYAGRSPEMVPSLRFSLQKFCPLLAASLVYYAALLIIVLVTSFAIAILVQGVDSAVGVVFALLAILAFTAGFAACLWLTVILLPLFPVIVIEEKGPINAIRRCMELGRGRWGYMGAGYVVLWVLEKILGAFLHAIFNDNDPASVYFHPMGVILSFLPKVLYIPLLTILSTVLYMSVRVDKEGLNRQVLQRELSDPAEYHPPVSDYRQVALVDDRQQPNVVPTISDDDFA